MASQKRPSTIGPYIILEVIGEGGMGVVYRAARTDSHEVVAVKTARASQADQLSSFRREIHALMRIRHSGIVRIFEEGLDHGLPWYAMELLDGHTLSDYNERNWNTPTRVSSPLAFSLAQVDQVTHKRGGRTGAGVGTRPSSRPVSRSTGGKRRDSTHPSNSGSRSGSSRPVSAPSPAPVSAPAPARVPTLRPSKSSGHSTTGKVLEQPVACATTNRSPTNRAAATTVAVAELAADLAAAPPATVAPRSAMLPAAPRPPAAGGRLPELISLMYRLCAPLAFLHGEGIVHCDLKPTNVFIRPDGSPVLMDFGLAWRFAGLGREVLDIKSGVSGTPSYMAPEQILGALVDARTDLYAVGCMLYESVTGKVPFGGNSYRDIITGHLADSPIPPSSLVDGVPEALETLIFRLLEKHPRDRLGHAADMMVALAEVAAEIGAELPAESAEEEKPRAYVYRPELAGREDILRQLSERVGFTLQGKGGCVLIGGESGIGKTYLAMEVGRRALGRGMDVVTGACLPVVGASQEGLGNALLQPFSRLLQTIADRCFEKGPELHRQLLGPRGKVLAACEPTLLRVPGEEAYPDPPELPAQASRERLLTCLRETIAAVAAEKPLLLILDDLQWADELSVRFLSSLSEDFFKRHKVLLLGTYRAEEKTAALHQLSRRPDVEDLRLGRLDERTVSALVGGMLAIKSPPAALVEFLARASEGNPFFIAEYLRTAVAEGLLYRDGTGKWQVGHGGVEAGLPFAASLPIPGSLRAVVGRRLDGLTPGARELALAASVLGREFDRELLFATVEPSEMEALDAIEELVAREVFEQPSPGLFRFVHDKLCETAYDRVPEERRRALHHRAAVTIEARHAETPDRAHVIPLLAHHWSMAQVDDEKTLAYLERAGEQSLRTAAYGEAAGFFRKALALDERRRARLSGSVGAKRLARWERHLGEACTGLGDMLEAEIHFGKTLGHLGQRLPVTRAGWVKALGAQLTTHAAQKLGLGRAPVSEPEIRDDLGEAAIAAALMTRRFYVTDNLISLITVSLLSVNCAEEASPPIPIAIPYTWLGFVAGMRRIDPLARAYFKQARTRALEVKDRSQLVFTLCIESVYQIGAGGWALAEGLTRRALDVLRDGSDPLNYESHLTILGHLEYYTGRFESSRQRYASVLRSARTRSNIQHATWGLFSIARSLLPMGHAEDAVPLLCEARAALAAHPEAASEIICHGLLASAYLRIGEHALARRMAEETSARIRNTRPTGFANMTGYIGAAEVYLESWAAEPDEASSWAAPGALRICADLQAFARVFPIAQPAAYLCEGQIARLSGRPHLARRWLERSLALARQLEMPYDEALAHLELARLPGGGQHLDRAEDGFARLGCLYHLEQVADLRDRAADAAR